VPHTINRGLNARLLKRFLEVFKNQGKYQVEKRKKKKKRKVVGSK